MCCPKDVVCCLCADRNLQGVTLLLLHIMLKFMPMLTDFVIQKTPSVAAVKYKDIYLTVHSPHLH